MTKEKHDELVEQLDQFYLQAKSISPNQTSTQTNTRINAAKRQILQNQSAITGLFPSSSAESSDASIKTSIWAASSIFALYLAYSKRVDNDQGKAHDLGQSVVKCMRGILFAWMRQSEKVESFKANQCPEHALHLKFDLHSGLANDFEYPHLQIDVVSLYLIFLAEFIASGLDIIYCMDEVTFIQNLVYYVERAYRTPDYGNCEQQSGPWTASDSEWLAPAVGACAPAMHAPAQLITPPRAHQSNSGPQQQQASQELHCNQARPPTACANCSSEHQSLEIHATSIGMAKSALEAINGCNLFGGKGANWSIIYSDIDAHSRNRSIFETLLPRESRSKNTASYLLATISWPCFATNDPALYGSTKSKILRKLKGKYGLKRYLRDPYGTVLGQQREQQQVGAVARSGAEQWAASGEPSQEALQLSSVSFERETSFSSTTSLGSSISLGEQPRAKQRKSSYFSRKTQGPAAAAAALSSTSYQFSSPSSQQQQQQQQPQVQRSESSSARMSKRFEHIESEWPLFICFLIIDGIFKQDYEQVSENERLLYEKLLKVDAKFGDYLMPKYYYVPSELIRSEKSEPDSVQRLASSEGSSSEQLYLTGQAILLITRLLLAGLVHPSELDPLRRHQPAYERPRRTIGRYSSFQATSPDLVVQVVLIAESIRLQAMMANYGIQTQTPREVEPVQIWSPAQLIKVYEYLGVNQKLSLKGRPARPIGALGTSKLYRICGQTIICYPLIFEVSDFYLAQDMLLLIDDIQNELNFIGRYWRMSGRPTVCLIIREEHLRDLHFRDLLDLLVQFKNGQLKKSGLRIKTGRLQNLISSSCIEHLDFLHLLPHEHLPQFESFRQLVESPKQSLLLSARQQTEHDEYQQQVAGSSAGRRLSEARYSAHQQRAAAGAACSRSADEQQHGDTDDEQRQQQLQQPSKTRRVLLCSASSNNLAAIDELAGARDDTPAALDDTSDDFHSMNWDHDQQLNQSSLYLSSSQRQSSLARQDSSEPNGADLSDEEYLSFGHSFSQLSSSATSAPPSAGHATGAGPASAQAKDKDCYDCYKEAPTWPTLIELLRTCADLSSQSQLLAILWEREGPNYCIDEQSVEQRLDRVGALACQARNWSVVRYCSAVLRRSVESLSPWLTSILVNGKQISLGQGHNEKIINNPLTPTEIHTLIYSTVNTKNPCDAVLQQEIALYIGRLISTKPEYFEGMLTIRVANFMSAMRSYLSIKNNERRAKLVEKQQQQQQQQLQQQQQARQLSSDQHQQDDSQQVLLDLRIKHEHGVEQSSLASSSCQPSIVISSANDSDSPSRPKKRPATLANQLQPDHHQQQQPNLVARPLESLSPSEVRRLLVRVLNDDQSLPISDRRQITGELCRVPRDFYDKVWSLLHCTNVGIVIGQRMLRSVPILTNMTQDDLNFALKVEAILSSISCPKLRQINVEFLMALHAVLERHPELRFDTEALDLDKIINLSLEKFRQDNARPDYGLSQFYGMTNQMTMLYAIRTVFDCLLPARYIKLNEFQFM